MSNVVDTVRGAGFESAVGFLSSVEIIYSMFGLGVNDS